MAVTPSAGSRSAPREHSPREHSPRERIEATALRLFYRDGIQATGVGELAEAAGVSKRTLYQLYPSKADLIAAYARLAAQGRIPLNESALERLELPPRQRLLALFDRPAAPAFRGCPLHNAAVELPDPGHPARRIIDEHKRWFVGRVVATAAEAGARDPDELGHRLAVLFEGACALGTVLNPAVAFGHARGTAALLVDLAIPAGDGEPG
jgi:AcrR family transcriptional regulator